MIEIKEVNLQSAYNTADEKGKEILRALFPNMKWIKNTKDNRSITERIKTFEDACKELGEEHPFVKEWQLGENLSSDLESYLKLRIVCAALNEGWEPQFIEDERRWYPWFMLWKEEALAKKSDRWKHGRWIQSLDKYQTEYACLISACSGNNLATTAAGIGSRLCLKSESLADYAGEQFLDLWMDYYLIRKNTTIEMVAIHAINR